MELIHGAELSRALDRTLESDSAPTSEQMRSLRQYMTALAEYCINLGHTQTGADILAFVLRQSDADPLTLERAEEGFAELESRVCPRIILDAREFAADMDLPGMIHYLLDIAPRPRI